MNGGVPEDREMGSLPADWWADFRSFYEGWVFGGDQFRADADGPAAKWYDAQMAAAADEAFPEAERAALRSLKASASAPNSGWWHMFASLRLFLEDKGRAPEPNEKLDGFIGVGRWLASQLGGPPGPAGERVWVAAALAAAGHSIESLRPVHPRVRKLRGR